jgi:opacity protein-like surface antigen
MILGVAAGTASAQADIPGRISLGFDAGGTHTSNDSPRWGASGAGYGYFAEAAYEPSRWLVLPIIQWGYAYTTGDVPEAETGGYPTPPTDIKGEANTFVFGGRVRVPLWRMKLRPYAGGGVAWTTYTHQVVAGPTVLLEGESSGTGWVGLAGLEFFPDPSRGFSFSLDYRYGSTTQDWKTIPAGGKGASDDEFNLKERVISVGVKIYTL